MPTTSRRSAPTTGRQAAIALDLGGTKLASALFLAEGRPIAKRTIAVEGRSGEEVGNLLIKEIARLKRAAAKRGLPAKAVGISVPGIVNRRSGTVWAPNIPGWEDFPLRSVLRTAVDDALAKLVVENDRAASILGEAWQGAARSCRDAIFLAVGTGIGAGILVDGRVLRGAHGIAGAVGWLALDRPLRPEYVACGCFESHASGEGLTKVLEAELAGRKKYRGPLRSRERLTARDLFAAYDEGDEIAKHVLAQAIEFWGMASANLISIFDPEKIIFGGGVFGPATRFIDAIAAEARKWAQPVAMDCVRFEASQLGGDAALYGAAYLVLGKRG